MSASKLLDRLTWIKQTGSAQWIASCPAHEDRSPSLHVREKDNGVVLVKCFAGCGAADVMEAVGLGLSDLFEKALEHHLPPSRSSIPARDLLEVIDHETTVATLITSDVVARRTINEAQVQRLALAAARIAKARDHARA
jgi:hypothetical protein